MDAFALFVTSAWIVGHAFWIWYFWPHYKATAVSIDSYRVQGNAPPESLIWAQRALVLQIGISTVNVLVGVWPIVIALLEYLLNQEFGESALSVLPLVMASLAAPSPAAIVWYVIQRGQSYANTK